MRRHREAQRLTDEERTALRAEVRDFIRRTGCGHPLALPPTPDQVREHVLRTAEIT